jgi:amino acid adenylation domain-containing protein
MSDRRLLEALVTRAPDGDRDTISVESAVLLPPSVPLEIMIAALTGGLGELPSVSRVRIFSIGLFDSPSELELRCDVELGLVEITRLRADRLPRRVPVLLAEVASDVSSTSPGVAPLTEARAQQSSAPVEIYRELSRAGLHYGSQLQALLETSIESDRASATIFDSGSNDGYCFPPQAMEAGFQLAALLLNRRNNRVEPRTVQRVEALWLAQPKIRPTMVTAEVTGEWSARLRYYGVDGRLLARIEGAQLATVSTGWPSDCSAELCEAVVHAAGWATGSELSDLRLTRPFIDLGLDSLRATRLVAHLRERYGLELPLPALLDAATLSHLHPMLRAPQKSEDATPTLECSRVMLTPTQRGYWVGEKLWPASAHAYFEISVRELDLDRLEQCFCALVNQHAALQTIVYEDGTQEVAGASFVLGRNQWSLSSDARQRLLDFRALWSNRRFDLHRGPMIDAAVSILPGDEKVVHVSVSLVAADLDSLTLLATHLIELYRGSVGHSQASQKSFLEFAAHTTSTLVVAGRYVSAKEYWKKRIESIPPPPQLPMLAAGPHLDARCRRVQHVFDERQRGMLRAAAQKIGVTETALFCGAFAQVLLRWSTRPELTLVLTHSRRPPGAEWQEVVGDFSSTILVSLEDRGESTREVLRRTQREIWSALEYSEYSAVDCMKDLGARDSRWRNGYVVLTSGLGRSASRELIPRDWVESLRYGVSQTPNVLLDCQLIELENDLLLQWDYVESKFAEGLVPDMFGSWLRHLSDIAHGDAILDTRPDLLPAKQAKVRAAVNQTEAVPQEWLAHELFEAAAARTPRALAIAAGDRTISYAELNMLSDRVAAQLAARGVENGARAAVYLDKGIQQVASVLGIVKAGGAYVPVSTAWPVQRANIVIDQCDPALVIVETDTAAGWPLQCTFRGLADGDTEFGSPRSAGGNQALAYILYTSGTTGTPKGVMVEHRSLVNRVQDVCERFGLSARDRVFGLTSLEHDMSTFDVFGSLAVGAALILPDPDRVRDPSHWCQLMQAYDVTVWNTVPAFMGMLLEFIERQPSAAPASLRHIWLSGDWIPVAYVARIRRFWPQARLVSLGGATETTIWDIYHEIGDGSELSRSVPYGRPMRNAKYHVLNEQGEPCPDGVQGELFSEGIGLARGYWADEEKTSEKFVRRGQSARLYRTGDMGRYGSDGTVEFLGRMDRQVKIRGVRVELEEVEHFLREVPGVANAAVIVTGERGAQRMIGFVVASDALDGRLNISEFLRGRVPGSMVPALIVTLPELPLTRNGKVDRAALESLARRESGAKASALQGVSTGRPGPAAIIVAEQLSLARLDPRQRIFALGATSVDIVALDEALRKRFGRSPGLAALFEDPTVDDLDRFIELGEIQPEGAVNDKGSSDLRVPVFCFPFAGGAAHEAFWRWKSMLSDECRVIPVEYPGHGARLSEHPAREMKELVADLVPFVRSRSTGRAVAFYGQSLGGLVAFEVACALSEMAGVQVGGLVVGACVPPHCWRVGMNVGRDLLPSSGGALSTALGQDIALLAAYLRTRADNRTRSLDCDIHVFSAEDDPTVSIEQLREWQRYTSGRLTMSALRGGHFFSGAEAELALGVLKSAVACCVSDRVVAVDIGAEGG